MPRLSTGRSEKFHRNRAQFHHTASVKRACAGNDTRYPPRRLRRTAKELKPMPPSTHIAQNTGTRRRWKVETRPLAVHRTVPKRPQTRTRITSQNFCRVPILTAPACSGSKTPEVMPERAPNFSKIRRITFQILYPLERVLGFCPRIAVRNLGFLVPISPNSRCSKSAFWTRFGR